KEHMEKMEKKGVIAEWELPYEEILTRLTAAIFFLTPASKSKLDEIWEELSIHNGLNYRLNEDKDLSRLEWRVEFNKGYEL
ncbi:hypothetical protein, partial [Fulvivirga kasyanovii]